MGMHFKKVEIVARVDGTKHAAELVVCPSCEGEVFVCYFPEGIDHLHFQCFRCAVTFCDGCDKGGEK